MFPRVAAVMRRVRRLGGRSHCGAGVILEIGRVETDRLADEHHRFPVARNLDQELGQVLEPLHAVASAQDLDSYWRRRGVECQLPVAPWTGEWRCGTRHDCFFAHSFFADSR